MHKLHTVGPLSSSGSYYSMYYKKARQCDLLIALGLSPSPCNGFNALNVVGLSFLTFFRGLFLSTMTSLSMCHMLMDQEWFILDCGWGYANVTFLTWS